MLSRKLVIVILTLQHLWCCERASTEKAKSSHRVRRHLGSALLLLSTLQRSSTCPVLWGYLKTYGRSHTLRLQYVPELVSLGKVIIIINNNKNTHTYIKGTMYSIMGIKGKRVGRFPFVVCPTVSTNLNRKAACIVVWLFPFLSSCNNFLSSMKWQNLYSFKVREIYADLWRLCKFLLMGGQDPGNNQ